MPLGRLWPDDVLVGPHTGALVVDPSPSLRGTPPGRLRTAPTVASQPHAGGPGTVDRAPAVAPGTRPGVVN